MMGGSAPSANYCIMKIISKFLMICALMISSVSANAAPSLPVVEILGKNYYVYEIKKGDSLFGISRAYGWDYDQLQQLNPKAVSPLQKGMKVYYPAEEDAAKTQKVSNKKMQEDCHKLTHIVKRGETVYAISRMYGIPVNTIFELNPGSKTGIKEGETLLLAKNNVSDEENNADFYTIKKGDTLYGVAKAHFTSVAAIMKSNPGVSEKNFKAGEIIRLPERGTGVKSSVREVKEESLLSFSTYKVDKKDTWDTIAEKTGVDKEDLLEVNKGAGEKPKKKSIVTVPEIETTTVEKTFIEEDFPPRLLPYCLRCQSMLSGQNSLRQAHMRRYKRRLYRSSMYPLRFQAHLPRPEAAYLQHLAVLRRKYTSSHRLTGSQSLLPVRRSYCSIHLRPLTMFLSRLQAPLPHLLHS